MPETGFASLMLIFLVLPSGLCINKVHLCIFNNLCSCKFLAWVNHNYPEFGEKDQTFFIAHIPGITWTEQSYTSFQGVSAMDQEKWAFQIIWCWCRVEAVTVKWQNLSHSASKLERNLVSVLFRKLWTFSILELPLGSIRGWNIYTLYLTAFKTVLIWLFFSSEPSPKRHIIEAPALDSIPDKYTSTTDLAVLFGTGTAMM